MGDVLFRKKKRGPISDIKKSILDQDSLDDNHDEGPSVVLKEKRTTANPLRQSSRAYFKRQRVDQKDSDQESESESETETEKHVDRLSDTRTRAVTSDSRIRNSNVNREDAVRHSNWDLEVDSDTVTSAAAASAGRVVNENGIYRGAGGYTSYIAQRDDGTSSKMRSRGPIRSTTTVRSSTVMDYQPDICKDYKETGYCGFGDTCKFLHDRSDYLAGWQLDVLPNSVGRGRDLVLSDTEQDRDHDDEEQEIPFACLLCRQAFTDPIVTRCGHYFCCACAIQRYSKTSKCFACGAQTNGLFNSATKLIERMQKIKARKAQERSERRRALGLDHDPDKNDDDE